MQVQQVAITAGVFFAYLLALTYLSRFLEVKTAWAILSPLLLILAWGLGNQRRASLAALICTIVGAVIPVLGFLIPYTGLTLSLAGVLSAIWLAARNWYNWFRLESGRA